MPDHESQVQLYTGNKSMEKGMCKKIEPCIVVFIIFLFVGGLVLLEIYFIKEEDGSLS